MSDDRWRRDPEDDGWDDEVGEEGWGPEATQDLGSAGSMGGWDSRAWGADAGQAGWAAGSGEEDTWGPDATSDLGEGGSQGQRWDAESWESGGQQPWSSGTDAGLREASRDARGHQPWSSGPQDQGWAAGSGDADWQRPSRGADGVQPQTWDSDTQRWVADPAGDEWGADPSQPQQWDAAGPGEQAWAGNADQRWDEIAPEVWTPHGETDGSPSEPQSLGEDRWSGDTTLDEGPRGSGPAWDTAWDEHLAGVDVGADAADAWQHEPPEALVPAGQREQDATRQNLWDSDATLPPTAFETVAPHLKGKGSGKVPAARVLIPSMIIVLLTGLAAVEVLILPPTEQTAAPVPQAAAAVGLWYCPAVAGEGEEASLAIAAAGDEASRVTVVRHTPEGQVSGSPETVEPGVQLDVPLENPEPVSVRWAGGPSVVTWRVNGEEGAAAPCLPGPSPTWYVSGLNTAAGAQSTLHLFNPFPADAVARVVFTTPEGPITLVRTDNVLVRAGEQVQLDLGEFQPEVSDLGVIVEVQAGRLISQGEVTYEPIEGETGPSGRALVPAAAATADFWAFAFARADDNSSSWLDVQNPGEREAAVEVRVSSPAASGSLLGEVAVPAGGMARIDLADVSEDVEFGVAVDVVNDVPVVVTRTAQLRSDDREGVATSLGSGPGTDWALAGAGTRGFSARLGLYNPGTEPVTVAVDAGPATPEDWGAVDVEPNGRAQVELAEVSPDQVAIPLRVTANGPVVPEFRSLADEGALRSWTALATPAASWAGPATRPPIRRDPGLPSIPLVSAERVTESFEVLKD